MSTYMLHKAASPKTSDLKNPTNTMYYFTFLILRKLIIWYGLWYKMWDISIEGKMWRVVGFNMLMIGAVSLEDIYFQNFSLLSKRFIKVVLCCQHCF